MSNVITGGESQGSVHGLYSQPTFPKTPVSQRFRIYEPCETKTRAGGVISHHRPTRSFLRFKLVKTAGAATCGIRIFMTIRNIEDIDDWPKPEKINITPNLNQSLVIIICSVSMAIAVTALSAVL